MNPWKRRFLLETSIFRCYVSFGEGNFFRGTFLESVSFQEPILGTFWGFIHPAIRWARKCYKWRIAYLHPGINGKMEQMGNYKVITSRN